MSGRWFVGTISGGNKMGELSKPMRNYKSVATSSNDERRGGRVALCLSPVRRKCVGVKEECVEEWFSL